MRNAHRGHDRIVAEDTAEVVGVGKNIFLQRQEHARGIHQIDGRNTVFDRDVLRANYLLRGHREKRTGFYGGIVHDQHDETSMDSGQSGDHASGRGGSPLFIHAVGSKGSEFKKCSGINQQIDAFAGGEASFGVLVFDCLWAPAFANDLFFIADLRDQIG